MATRTLKSNWCNKQTETVHFHHTVWYISLPSPHDYARDKIFSCGASWRTSTLDDKFSITFKSWMRSLRDRSLFIASGVGEDFREG